MANERWTYQVVEVKPRMFTSSVDLIQAELNRLGPLGWELVAVTQSHQINPVRLYLKKAP